MNHRVKIIALLVCYCLIAAIGCKKSNSGGISCSSGEGGPGGNSTLTVTAEHADSFIDSCTFYIKYGACDAPANGIYDDSAIEHQYIPGDTLAFAIFRNLKAGNYYLYGVGYHLGYAQPNIKGGDPCTIPTNNDSMEVYVPTYSYNN